MYGFVYLILNPLTTGNFSKYNFIFLLLFPINLIFRYETGLYNEYLVGTVETDGLVLKHQVFSSHSSEHAPMRFQSYTG